MGSSKRQSAILEANVSEDEDLGYDLPQEEVNIAEEVLTQTKLEVLLMEICDRILENTPSTVTRMKNGSPVMDEDGNPEKVYCKMKKETVDTLLDDLVATLSQRVHIFGQQVQQKLRNQEHCWI